MKNRPPRRSRRRGWSPTEPFHRTGQIWCPTSRKRPAGRCTFPHFGPARRRRGAVRGRGYARRDTWIERVTYGLIGGSVVVAIWILILVGWAIVQIAAGGKL
jgi:hypothetical protein